MKNHLVLLFSFSFPFSLTLTHSDIFCDWLWFYSFIYFLFLLLLSFPISLAFVVIDCVRILILRWYFFLRNIHARFFTFNPNWLNQFSLWLFCQIYNTHSITIIYTDHMLTHTQSMCWGYYSMIFVTRTSRSDETNRQTGRHTPSETEIKKWKAIVTREWQCVCVCKFVLLFFELYNVIEC